MSDDTPKLATADKALLRAASGADMDGLVTLTPEVLQDIQKSLAARYQDIAARYPKLVEDCPYETRLAVVAWAMEHIVTHAEEGGSFRYLIYERLGFGPDAYVPLYQAGGMTISNEFNLAENHKPKPGIISLFTDDKPEEPKT